MKFFKLLNWYCKCVRQSISLKMSQGMWQKNGMSGRYLLLKTKQHIPATSAIIATTVSSTLQRLRQNRFSFHRTRKEMNLEAARSCLWADWCPNRWRMDGESWRTWFIMSTHPDRAQIWLFRTQQAPDFTLPTCFQNKSCGKHIHTLSKKWKSTWIVTGAAHQALLHFFL